MKSCCKQAGVASIVILCVLFLTSCNTPQKSSSSPERIEREQIPFRITWTDYSGRGIAVQKIVDTYNQSGACKVVLWGGNEDIKEIETLLKSKKAMPVLVLPYRYVRYLGEQGALTDLTETFEKDKALFYPELWKLGTYKNKVYGIPWLGHSICLIYNKSLLDQAGINPASIKSLDDLVEALKKVEAKTDAKGIGLVGANHNDVSWMVNQFIYGFGSKLVDESGEKVVINNEKAKAAIAFYKNQLGAHAQPTWVDDTGVEVMDYFRNQEIAFEFQGIWGETDIEKNGSPFEVGIINLEDIGLYAEVGPMMLSIPQNMEQEKQKEAVKFIEYMISTKAQEQIMNGEYSPEHDVYYPFRVPTRMDLKDHMLFKTYPQYLPFLKGFKRPSVDVPVAKWQMIKDTYYAPGLNQVMKSEMTTEYFLKMIETKGNEVLSQ